MKMKKTFITGMMRPWVIAIISLLMVSLVLSVGYQFFQATKKATFKEFNQRQLVMAREAATGIEMYLEFLAGALQAMAKEPGIFGLDETISRMTLALEFNELSHMGINDLAVLDAKGLVRYTAAAPQLEGVDFSWRKYFQTAKMMTASDSPIVQFIEFKGTNAGHKGILIAVPMFDFPADSGATSASGKFAGVVLCTFKLDTLTRKFVAPIKSSTNGHMFLIDNEHNVLWSPDNTLFSKNFLQVAHEFPAFQQILKKMATGEYGMAECSFYSFDESNQTYTQEKQEKLIAYLPVNFEKGLLALGIWAPKDDAERLILSVYHKQMMLVALIILITLVGSSYTIALTYRYNKILEKEVDTKTREFKESHQRLLTVFDSLDAGVYVADMETYEVLFSNKYLRDAFGAVGGQICWQVFQQGKTGPCDFCTNKKLLDDHGNPNGVHVWEYQNHNTGKWYDIRDRAIRWTDGRMVRMEISTDITARKLANLELIRAHNEMGTFCTILREIGVQQTLEGVSTFLMKEIQNILDTHYMQLFVFNSDRSGVFVLSEKGITVISDEKQIQTVSEIIGELDGLTINPPKKFEPPLLPDYFPDLGRQSVIPIRVQNYDDGAFVVACESGCLCEEKQLDLVELILEKASGTIKRAVLHHEEIHSLESRIESKSEFSGIIGKDPKMQVIYKLIEDIAPTDATVLIQGETGTGKEMVARAIYQQSLRNERPFVVINCSAYPSTLLESELFGHEKGAFTGAIRQKTGRFEQAHGGTVFLDEVGEISPSAQIKLLRIIQTQKFERLGGEQTVNVDVRILAATNKDLLQEVKSGIFREDLYYRLNVIPVQLPPLRQRRNDIPMLARHFQQKFAADHGGPPKDFSSEAMRRLFDHHWPGNVRELENSIEHAVVLSKDRESPIDVTYLPSALIIENMLAPEPAPAKSRTILDNEKELLKDVLEECNWNKSQAALRLGISRSTLYDKLKRYQLAKPTTH